MQKKVNPKSHIKKGFIFLLTPILVMLLITREFFPRYLFYAIEILIMSFLISLVFSYSKQILGFFMLPPHEEIITSKYFSTYYVKFMINAFFLTFSISILFYNKTTNFLQYSYPALTFLCASRILQYKRGDRVEEFLEVVYDFVIIIILFAFMRFMGTLSKLNDTSLLSMSFINIPIITKEDIQIFLLLSISVWALLSTFERLKLFNKMLHSQS